MMQCCVCEDWFHCKHLKFTTDIPKSHKDVTTDLICGECITKNEFLIDYVGNSNSSIVPQSDAETSIVDVTSNVNDANDDEPSSKKIKLDNDKVCTKPTPSENKYEKGSSIFCKDGWRKFLCQCENCKKNYENLKVEFLIDEEDTVIHYEEKGKGNERPSSYDASMEALNSLPRVNQINAITGYNRMKDKLFEFLQTFVVNNQIVTEEDIQRFFRNMKESNDNQPVNQPHFCR
jgi:E3 ubiquitin-protein ligase UBR7